MSLVLASACDRPPANRASAPTVTAPPAPASTPASLPALNKELGRIYQLINLRQTGRARAMLDQYRAARPSDGQAAFLVAMTYHREKRYATACEHFDEAVRLAPEYFVSHYFKAWALYYLGELDQARASFETHLRYDPNQADSHFGIGLIELDEDNLDAAEERFRRAIALEEKDPAASREVSKFHARLGEVFERRGRFADARTALERSVALFPDHYEAWWKLYRVLVRLGEEEAAAEALKQHDAAKERVHPGRRTAFPED